MSLPSGRALLTVICFLLPIGGCGEPAGPDELAGEDLRQAPADGSGAFPDSGTGTVDGTSPPGADGRSAPGADGGSAPHADGGSAPRETGLPLPSEAGPLGPDGGTAPATGPIGFGAKTTGGLGGVSCRVKTLADSGTGSLRACAQLTGPALIGFDLSGIIKLQSPINVKSDKTIDGRGRDITISGQGLYLIGVQNVVLRNLKITLAADDAIRLYGKTQHVWIDHCTLSSSGDGLLDITQAATDVTVSWTRFWKHDKTMLIGAGPDAVVDKVIRVTVHHCFFDGTISRSPRLRFGKVHSFNNLLLKAGDAQISQEGQFYSEANIYDGGGGIAIGKIGTDPLWADAVKSAGDLFLNGATKAERNPGSCFVPSSYYAYQAQPASETLRAAIKAGAGWQP